MFISLVRFFDYIIIFRSTKMLAQIADLRLCALMLLRPYVLGPFICALMSGFATVGQLGRTMQKAYFLRTLGRF